MFHQIILIVVLVNCLSILKRFLHKNTTLPSFLWLFKAALFNFSLFFFLTLLQCRTQMVSLLALKWSEYFVFLVLICLRSSHCAGSYPDINTSVLFSFILRDLWPNSCQSTQVLPGTWDLLGRELSKCLWSENGGLTSCFLCQKSKWHDIKKGTKSRNGYNKSDVIITKTKWIIYE